MSRFPTESRPHGSTTDTAFLGHVFLGYQLLDTLLWVQGWPAHPNLRLIATATKPSCSPTRLDVVVRHLDNYHRIVQKTKHHLKNRLELEGLSETTFSTQNLSLNSRASPLNVLQAALNNLGRATQSNRKAEYNEIFAQVYAAAFVMVWFRPVSHSPL
jgi:hypothetical protein